MSWLHRENDLHLTIKIILENTADDIPFDLPAKTNAKHTYKHIKGTAKALNLVKDYNDQDSLKELNLSEGYCNEVTIYTTF